MIAFQNNNDQQLLQKLRSRIKWDKRVSLADVDVVVKSGVVTLNGFVDSSYKRHAVLEIISATEGVWSVDDRLVVPEDYYRTDEELKKLIKDSIGSILKLGGEHIEIDVVDSVVKFEGVVYRPRLKALASGIAWELSGVRDCFNFIEIVSPPHRVPKKSSSPEFEIDTLVAMTRV